MITQEHMELPLEGLRVQDAVVVMQMIRRLVKSGILEEVELTPVVMTRQKLVESIKAATGVNYDNPQQSVPAGVTSNSPVAQ